MPQSHSLIHGPIRELKCVGGVVMTIDTLHLMAGQSRDRRSGGAVRLIGAEFTRIPSCGTRPRESSDAAIRWLRRRFPLRGRDVFP